MGETTSADHRPFERLQSFGDEKFTKILNNLMRGDSAVGVARMIQAAPPLGWGLFQDTTEKALTQQLNRLRLAAAEGIFGKAIAKRISEGAAPQIKRLEHISIPVLERLESVAEVQRSRVQMLVDRERNQGVYLASTNDVVGSYRQLLLDIQKIRFELGLDEFKGPVSTTLRGASQSVSMPDGTNIQKQVFEAISTIEEIFDQRKIPKLPH